jgi:hypothetical protein
MHHITESWLPGLLELSQRTCYAFLTVSILTTKRRLTLCILPLKSREGLQELVLELMGRIKSYVRSIAYIAFDNSF